MFVHGKIFLDFLNASLCLCFYLFTTISDTGVTYDEPTYFHYTLNILNTSKTFHEKFQTTPGSHPVFTYLWTIPFYLLTKNILPITTALRIGTSVFYLLFLCVFYFFIKKHFSTFFAFASTIILIGMPRVFFHSHLLALDFPIMALYFMSAAFFYEAITTQKKRIIFFAGITLGALLATKLTGALLFLALFIFLIYSKKKQNTLNTSIQLRTLTLLFFIAGITFTIFSPHLYENPFKIFSYPKLYATTQSDIFIFGKSYSAWHPTAYLYVPLTLLTTINLFPILLALIGIFIFVKNREKPVHIYFLIIFFATLLFFEWPFVLKRNGERYFLMLYPFLALFAGAGANKLATFLTLKIRQRITTFFIDRIIRVLIIIILLSSSIFTLWYSHPFESSYFNAAVGGALGVGNLDIFEVTYWLDELYYTLDWANTLPKNSIIGVSPYYAPYHWYQEQGMLRKDLIAPLDLPGIGYLVVILQHPNAWRFPEKPSLKPVYSVYNKQGAELVRVYNLTMILREEPGILIV